MTQQKETTITNLLYYNYSSSKWKVIQRGKEKGGGVISKQTYCPIYKLIQGGQGKQVKKR